MLQSNNKYKFLFAGGGTGGHLYPAIAVAEQIEKKSPDSEIMFIGTADKIESKVVPEHGYDFKSITISGFSRRLTLKNLLFPFKLIAGMIQSFFICLKYKPDVAIGTGAYVSGPAIWAASLFGAKIILLEQNSFPGVTNRLLERRATSVHLSYEDSKKYFKYKNKLKVTGNPLRIDLKVGDREEAIDFYKLNKNKKTLLVIGGSLGAFSINNAVEKNLYQFVTNDVQIIWQTGERYYEKFKGFASEMIRVMPFIDDVSKAYSAADLVLARAGATTIAEAAMLGLPVIFVPSTNVAANHQYKNAQSLENEGAAYLIPDDKVEEKLGQKVVELINDEEKLVQYRNKIKSFSKPDAAEIIAIEAIKFAEGK